MKGFAVDSAKRLHDMSAMVEQLCIQLQQALPKGDYDVLTKGKIHDAGTLKISRVNAFLESILRLHVFCFCLFDASSYLSVRLVFVSCLVDRNCILFVCFSNRTCTTR